MLLIALLTSLAAFGADGPVFRTRIGAEPSSLDWSRAFAMYEGQTIMNVMEGLVQLNGALEPEPALAEKWTVSEDRLEYLFTLRPGVKWSDGVPLKARDFVAGWKRLLAPANTNDYQTFLFDVKNAEAYHKGKLKRFEEVGVTAVDDTHLRVRLRRPVPHFLVMLSFWATFPLREDQVKQPNWDRPPRLVTLGPYLLSRWEPGKELVYVRNPHYYGPPPALERVVEVIETDDEKARVLLQTNKVDALPTVRIPDIDRYALDATQPWELKHFGCLCTVYLGMNTAKGFTADLRVRKAIAMAIDRAKLPLLLQGGQRVADSFIPKGLAGYEPNLAFAYNVEMAWAQLSAAGIKDPKLVPPLRLVTQDGAAQIAAAEFVRDQLRVNLGLRVTVEAIAMPLYKAALKRGDFELEVGHWAADYPDATSFLETRLSYSGSNYMGWKNAEYDSIVHHAWDSKALLDRVRLYAEAQKILIRSEVELAPLFHRHYTALVRKTFSGYEITPFNFVFYKRITTN